jgi:hypothetical protein
MSRQLWCLPIQQLELLLLAGVLAEGMMSVIYKIPMLLKFTMVQLGQLLVVVVLLH